jgi:hypothetical protein
MWVEVGDGLGTHAGRHAQQVDRAVGPGEQRSGHAVMVACGAGAAVEAFGMWTPVSQEVSGAGQAGVRDSDAWLHYRSPARFSQSSATTSMSFFWFMICVIIPASAGVSSFADTVFSVAVATGVMLSR